MPALSTIALAGAGVGIAGSALSAFGKENPKFDPNNSLGQIQLGPQGALGAAGEYNASSALNNISNLRGSELFSSNQDLAGLLRSYSQGGYLPTAQDNIAAQSFAASQFDPQRVQMQQAFSSQLTDANRQAALSGRGINDPVLRAKLAQEQTRQTAQLNSQQGAFATQYAMQQPMQRLQFAEGRSNVLLNDLNQRMGLENSIFNSGLQAQQQDFNQRSGLFQNELNRTSSIANGQFQQQAQSKSFLQNLGSTLSGGIAGFGAGMSAAGPISSIFGGGGAGLGGLGQLPQGPSLFNPGTSSSNFWASNPFSSASSSPSYMSFASPLQQANYTAGLNYGQ